MRNVVILKEKTYTFESGQIGLWRSSQPAKKAEERYLSEISFKKGIKKGAPMLVSTDQKVWLGSHPSKSLNISRNKARSH